MKNDPGGLLRLNASRGRRFKGRRCHGRARKSRKGRKETKRELELYETHAQIPGGSVRGNHDSSPGTRVKKKKGGLP